VQRSPLASTSNVLMFPARSLKAELSDYAIPRLTLPTSRFGRPRQSIIYHLGVWLLRCLQRIKQQLTAALDSFEARYVAWRIRRSGKAILRALDELVILNTQSFPAPLDDLMQEITARQRHWNAATTDIQTRNVNPAAGPRVVSAN
jgi:hypothetical protein